LWEETDQDPNQLQVWMGKIYEEKTDANGQHILFHIYAGDQQVCTCEAGSALAGGNDTGNVRYYYHRDKRKRGLNPLPTVIAAVEAVLALVNKCFL
jgi:hypothetical protein